MTAAILSNCLSVISFSFSPPGEGSDISGADVSATRPSFCSLALITDDLYTAGVVLYRLWLYSRSSLSFDFACNGEASFNFSDIIFSIEGI